jgi:transposase
MLAPIFVRALTAGEQRELRSIATSSCDGKETRKALAVQMSAKGKRIPEIARELGISTATIRRWILAFMENGLASIPRAGIPGRPRVADEEFEAAAAEALSKSPLDSGYDATAWSAELLRRHLSKATHVLISQRTMYDVLHRLNFVFKRPKLDLKHKQDPVEVSRAKQEAASAKKAS